MGYDVNAAAGALEYGAFVPFGFAPEPVTKRSVPGPMRDTLLVGLATVYGRAHAHKGLIEVFDAGCFHSSLRKSHDVGFLANHTWVDCFGSTGDGSLELHESDAGLGFALKPTDDAKGRQLVADVKAGKFAMSVGYTCECRTERKVAGEDVVFIQKATLLEISVVARPAVREASITFTKASTFGSLAEACRSGRLTGLNAAGRFERAAAKLLAALA